MVDVIEPPRDDYKLHSARMATAEATQDQDDYNNAVSGADVGRIQRHGVRQEIDPMTGEKKGSAAARHARTLQWLLENDVGYSTAHRAATQAITETFELADDILERLMRQKADIALDIKEALDDAPTLPDGRKVFRDANGVVYDENGERVDDEITAHIQWRGNEPSYEHYVALREKQAQTDAAILDVQRAEADLGDLQNELNREDRPAAISRVQEIESEIKGIGKDIKNIEQNVLLTVTNAPVFEATTPEVAPATVNVAFPQISQ